MRDYKVYARCGSEGWLRDLLFLLLLFAVLDLGYEDYRHVFSAARA